MNKKVWLSDAGVVLSVLFGFALSSVLFGGGSTGSDPWKDSSGVVPK